MRRKVLYGVAILLIICLAAGGRLYQKYTTQSSYLGTEIVNFGENLAAKDSVEPEDAAKPPVTEAPDATALPQVTAKPTKKKSSKQYEEIISHGKIKEYSSGTIVIDDSAYELYTYVDSTAQRYADAVNKLTKKLKKKATVYTMVAPSSIGITLPDNKQDKVNSTPQDKALKKIKKKLSDSSNFIPLYDTLMQHRTEYIYFRTDHHWTSLGAYYAYTSFCKSKGISANALSSYEKKKVKGFLGTFYQDTNNKNLKADTLVSYYPLSSSLQMKYTNTDGVTEKAPVIADASDYSASLKYCAYIAGDNPYTVINNKEIKEKTSCVVVKESYGNALVPFLVDHYRTVYVIDYRYWEGSLSGFVKKKNVSDVLLINNISMTRNQYLVGKLTQVISQ